jgi:hypothetical protein
MSVEALNRELVDKQRKARGITRKWIIEQLGLGGDGYKFLRGEWMPKDAARRSSLLRKLAQLLSLDEDQLIVRLEAKVG